MAVYGERVWRWRFPVEDFVSSIIAKGELLRIYGMDVRGEIYIGGPFKALVWKMPLVRVEQVLG